jgi:hypothetical protein
MDAAKIKKLQDYASFLVKQAESKESQGNTAEAARDYVKLVDILLLLANEAKDHPTWQQMITKVEYYQKKVKALGAGPESVGAKDVPQKFRDSETRVGVQSQSNLGQERVEQNPSSSSLLKSFKKISGFGKGQTSEIPKQQTASETPAIEKISQAFPDPPSNWMNEFPKPKPTLAIETKGQQASSPTYLEVLSENESLKKRIQELEANEREYLQAFEEIKKQTEEKIASMVPKKELETVELKLLESVPKSEYEKLKGTLREMVPREKLRETERYVSELEARLQNSVPRTVLAQIQEYTELLISSSSLSLVDLDEDMRSKRLVPARLHPAKDSRRKITLDIDPSSKRNGATPESIMLEINMKPQLAQKNVEYAIKPRFTKSESSEEIQEVQSELSEIQTDMISERLNE